MVKLDKGIYLHIDNDDCLKEDEEFKPDPKCDSFNPFDCYRYTPNNSVFRNKKWLKEADKK